jgi:phosphatidate cytidylyltransferase
MLAERAISAAILVPALFVVLFLGEPWIAVAILVVVGLGCLEAFTLLRAAGYATLPILGTVMAGAVVIDAAAPSELGGSGALLTAIGLSIVAVGAFTKDDPREGLTAWVATTFAGLYVAQLAFVLRLASAAPAIPATAPLAGLGTDRAWILLLILGVWAYDTGAYLAGSRWGTTRFMTHLSGSKTYAGLIGGLVATTLVVAIMFWAVGQPILLAIPLGLLLGLAAQAGDLAESMLKRAARAKDSSALIPGHGGVLDRIDSFLFAAPVATLYVITLVR